MEQPSAKRITGLHQEYILADLITDVFVVSDSSALTGSFPSEKLTIGGRSSCFVSFNFLSSESLVLQMDLSSTDLDCSWRQQSAI